MNTVNFLIKLKKQGKIELVEPNEEIKNSYLNDSDSYLISSKILLDKDKIKESTQLSYFSIYYSILALLSKIGVKCENHLGSILLLKEIFDIDNSFALMFQKKRVETYYPHFELEKQNLSDLIGEAEFFRKNIFDFLSKINSEKIKNYRNKFNELLGEN